MRCPSCGQEAPEVKCTFVCHVGEGREVEMKELTGRQRVREVARE